LSSFREAQEAITKKRIALAPRYGRGGLPCANPRHGGSPTPGSRTILRRSGSGRKRRTSRLPG